MDFTTAAYLKSYKAFNKQMANSSHKSYIDHIFHYGHKLHNSYKIHARQDGYNNNSHNQSIYNDQATFGNCQQYKIFIN